MAYHLLTRHSTKAQGDRGGLTPTFQVALKVHLASPLERDKGREVLGPQARVLPARLGSVDSLEIVSLGTKLRKNRSLRNKG